MSGGMSGAPAFFDVLAQLGIERRACTKAEADFARTLVELESTGLSRKHVEMTLENVLEARMWSELEGVALLSALERICHLEEWEELRDEAVEASSKLNAASPMAPLFGPPPVLAARDQQPALQARRAEAAKNASFVYVDSMESAARAAGLDLEEAAQNASFVYVDSMEVAARAAGLDLEVKSVAHCASAAEGRTAPIMCPLWSGRAAVPMAATPVAAPSGGGRGRRRRRRRRRHFEPGNDGQLLRDGGSCGGRVAQATPAAAAALQPAEAWGAAARGGRDDTSAWGPRPQVFLQPKVVEIARARFSYGGSFDLRPR